MEHCPCPAAAGAFYKRINRRLTQVQEMQNAPNILRKCIKYEYILQITHKDTN